MPARLSRRRVLRRIREPREVFRLRPRRRQEGGVADAREDAGVLAAAAHLGRLQPLQLVLLHGSLCSLHQLRLTHSCLALRQIQVAPNRH